MTVITEEDKTSISTSTTAPSETSQPQGGIVKEAEKVTVEAENELKRLERIFGSEAAKVVHELKISVKATPKDAEKIIGNFASRLHRHNLEIKKTVGKDGEITYEVVKTQNGTEVIMDELPSDPNARTSSATSSS